MSLDIAHPAWERREKRRAEKDSEKSWEPWRWLKELMQDSLPSWVRAAEKSHVKRGWERPMMSKVGKAPSAPDCVPHVAAVRLHTSFEHTLDTLQ